jgi:hypothetical protein
MFDVRPTDLGHQMNAICRLLSIHTGCRLDNPCSSPPLRDRTQCIFSEYWVRRPERAADHCPQSTAESSNARSLAIRVRRNFVFNIVKQEFLPYNISIFSVYLTCNMLCVRNIGRPVEREIGVYPKKQKNHASALCGKNAEASNIKADNTVS